MWFLIQGEDWSDGIPVNQLKLSDIFSCFLTGLQDYTTDKRGDVGSWVREASMGALRVSSAYNDCA